MSNTIELNNFGFSELTNEQLMLVEGGSWEPLKIAGLVTLGAVAIAASPVIVGAAIIGGAGVAVSVGTGMVIAGTGAMIVGKYGFN